MADQFDPVQANIALRDTWGLRRNDGSGARLDLKLGLDEKIDRKLLKRLEKAVGDGWEVAYRWHEPVEPLPYGAPDPRMREALLNDLEAELEQAGVDGASAVQAYPTGWLWIAKVMTHNMVLWAGEGEEIVIQDIN